jgi:hypothetical protein
MRKIVSVFAAIVFVASHALSTSAQDVDQAVNVVVPAVSVINVSGDPLALTFSTITGANFDPVTENSTTYSFAHNNIAAQKIVATLDVAYTGSIAVTVNLTAPTGGTSTGAVLLVATTGVDVVTAIPAVAEAGMAIEYIASASASEPTVDETNNVTFTIVAQ